MLPLGISGHIAPQETSVKKISTNVHSYLSSTEHVVLQPWTLSHQPLQEGTRKKEAIRINLSLCFNLSARGKGRIANAFSPPPHKKLSRANQKEKNNKESGKGPRHLQWQHSFLLTGQISNLLHVLGGWGEEMPSAESLIASLSGCLIPVAHSPHGPEAGCPCKTESQHT